MKNFLGDKKILFVFELANNHNGSKKNALKIIDAAKTISNFENIEFGFKLQFRNLKTFLHPSYKKSKNKHVKRFIDTKLGDKDYIEICKYIKKKKLKLIITPFDEKSVDLAEKCKVDIIKIASCSNNDWPLIEKISNKKKPVIASTGGITFDEIDNISNFFERKNIPLSILHCVSIYPTLNSKDFNINVIKKMEKRYPKNIIGYSGHEDESNFLPSICAVASGAKIIERHFSHLNEKNNYTIGKEKLEKLLSQINNSIEILGNSDKQISELEKESISSLQRGLFAKRNILTKKKYSNQDFYLAFPKENLKQLSAIDLSKDIILNKNIKKDECIEGKVEELKKFYVRKFVHRYKFMLNEAKIIPGEECYSELSHHYGIENIERFGAFLITIINGQYCKKLVCLLKDQFHPKHKHCKKIETFHVLSGNLKLKKENITYNLRPGDKIDVMNNEWHEFSSNTGCIFEEISTESMKKDSVYFDKEIQKNDYIYRKTVVNLI